MRLRSILLAFLLPLASLSAQDLATHRAAAKIDTVVPWMTDGFEAPDPGAPTPRLPKTNVDRGALLDVALARATAEKKLVFWYVPRIEGPQIIRGPILDDYMRVVVFGDRDLGPMIARRFVPLRMAADKAIGARLDLSAPDRIEPAIVFLKGNGEVVARLDRIRTFNKEFFRRKFSAVLEANGEAGEPDPLDAIVPADDAGRAALEGLRKLRAGAFAGAETALAIGSATSDAALRARARYAFAHAVLRQGRDTAAESAFRELVASDPDAPEAAQAAVNLIARPRDTTPMGPAFHRYEDVVDPPNDPAVFGAPTTARPHPADDVEAVVHRAVAFLLSAQTESGGWTDARYACCPNPRILPNVWVAATAASAAALRAWRGADPSRVDAALERAEGFLFDEARLARGHNEECYADAFRLIYLARRATDGVETDDSRRRMNVLVKEIGRQLGDDGFLAHEYPNGFATAAGAIALDRARRAGATVPDSLFKDAAKAIAPLRGAGGAFAYGSRGAAKRASDEAMKNSMGRNPMCDRALLLGGLGSADDLLAAHRNFEKWLPRLERIRVADYHTDGELGGFFFWHATYFTSEALVGVAAGDAAALKKTIRAHVASIPEFDGSFIDSHELGKSYGTAAALLTLANVLDVGD